MAVQFSCLFAEGIIELTPIIPRLPKFKEEDFPEPGTVFIAPTGDGRLSAGRVLRREFTGGAQAALIAASPWIGIGFPELDLPVLRETLILTHHTWKGQPQIVWVTDLMPINFVKIGKIALSLGDLAALSSRFSAWEAVPLHALMQWRWDYDRNTLLHEETAKAAVEGELRTVGIETRTEVMKTLTLDLLAGREWFTSWNSEIPTSVSDSSKTLVAGLVKDLLAAPKVTKVIVRRFLKRTVELFNELDSAHQFIFTIGNN